MTGVPKKVCFDKTRYVVYQPYVGLHLAYHAKRYLFSGRSRFQKIDIIDNDAYGRMLLLDNNIQHTEYDSRIFNEALWGQVKRAKLSRIIVLGGGSGQTARSLLETDHIRNVTIVEIDEVVVEKCKRYILGVKEAFEDSRVSLVIADAFSYLHTTKEQFDGAIIDFTELPFAMKNNVLQLRRLYADIKDKCSGRCSQYVGSTVGLSYGPKMRKLAENLIRAELSYIKMAEVFIPSFGAPHAFIHAGYKT